MNYTMRWVWLVLVGASLPRSLCGFRINSLRTMLSTEAAVSSISNRVNSDIISENVLVDEFSKMEHHPSLNTAFYILITVASIYYQYRRITTVDNKLVRLKKFSRFRNKLDMFLLVLSIVFTKNVESVF